MLYAGLQLIATGSIQVLQELWREALGLLPAQGRWAETWQPCLLTDLQLEKPSSGHSEFQSGDLI